MGSFSKFGEKQLYQIALSSGMNVWSIVKNADGSHGGTWKVTGFYPNFYWEAMGGGNLFQISVFDDKNIWGQDANGNVYQFVGKTNELWAPRPKVPGSQPSVLNGLYAGGSGTAWALNPSNDIYYYNDGGWSKTPGAMIRLALNTEWLYGIGPKYHAFYLFGTNEWIAVIGPDNKTEITAAGVSVAQDGTVYAYDPDVYSIVSGGDATKVETPETFSSVAVGSATNIWGQGSSGLYQYTGTGWSSPIKGPAGVLLGNSCAAADGSVWALDGSGNPYFWQA